MSAFALADNVVYHTYSTYERGLDPGDGTRTLEWDAAKRLTAVPLVCTAASSRTMGSIDGYRVAIAAAFMCRLSDG